MVTSGWEKIARVPDSRSGYFETSELGGAKVLSNPV
jgi:hypothetical protein